MDRNKVSALESGWRKWAEEDPAIRAIAVVGSHARGTARPDSDIDLIIICDQPEDYLERVDWITKFGKLLKAEREDWGLVQTWRITYHPDVEVEYNFTTLQWCDDDQIIIGTGRVINDGVRALYDPDLTIESLREKVTGLNMSFHAPDQLPSQWETPDQLIVTDSTTDETGELQEICDACAYIEKWCGPSHIAPAQNMIEGKHLPQNGTQGRHRLQSIRVKGKPAIVGYLEVYHGFPGPRDFWITTLAIHPEYQSQGLGFEVIGALVEQVSALEEFDSIGLNVGLKNWPALRFWIATGFKTIMRCTGDQVCTETTFSNLWLSRSTS